MKKCPGCGSVSLDEETTCGVCGADLWMVPPMTQTLEQSEIEDTTKRAAEDELRRMQIRKRAILRLVASVSATTVIMLAGLGLLFLGSLWGILLIFLGLCLGSYALIGTSPRVRVRSGRSR